MPALFTNPKTHKSVRGNVLLDTGSDSTMITASLAKELNPYREKVQLTLRGIGDSKSFGDSQSGIECKFIRQEILLQLNGSFSCARNIKCNKIKSLDCILDKLRERELISYRQWRNNYANRNGQPNSSYST
jgi:hypothetical protein